MLFFSSLSLLSKFRAKSKKKNSRSEFNRKKIINTLLAELWRRFCESGCRNFNNDRKTIQCDTIYSNVVFFLLTLLYLLECDENLTLHERKYNFFIYFFEIFVATYCNCEIKTLLLNRNSVIHGMFYKNLFKMATTRINIKLHFLYFRTKKISFQFLYKHQLTTKVKVSLF